MKTTLDLPDDLMRGMKIRAATQGRKLKDVIADAIRDSLAETRETPITKHPTRAFQSSNAELHVCRITIESAGISH